jgi:HK97 family phage portal protein
MNPIVRFFKAATTALTMRWTRGASWGLPWLAGTNYDYAKAAQGGRTNAAVMACVRWVQRALPEAPLTVMIRNADGELTPATEHPLQDRLDNPNPYYSGLHLLSVLVADLMLTGNAYVRKVRSGRSTVAELWWIPTSMIEPRWADDGSEFVGWYEYAADGIITVLDPADVIHIRQGFDPQNIRKGLSDLTCLLREVATDNEAANWTAAMVRNVNPPGVVISPTDPKAQATPQQLETMKRHYQERFSGDHRGEPMVMAGPTSVQVLSFSPQQMDLAAIRNVPEERITAVFGIPAAVVGLGTGLENTKVGATMAQMREQAYESCLIPMQRLIAAELQRQLVPDFGNPQMLRVQFDLSEVRVLQDDQNALHERARADLGAGLLTLNQALTMIGQEPVEGEAGDIRFVPNTVTVKTIDTLIPEDVPAQLAAPTPLRALPAPSPVDEPAAGKGAPPSALKAAALSDGDLIARYEAGLAPIIADLSDEIHGAFEEMVETVASRALSHLKSADHKDASLAGLVTDVDHADIRSLLRSGVLKGMRQAAEDLAPLTGETVRITRASPAYKAAVADMEARLPGMVETTGADFSRVIARLERRPGSVPLQDVRSALESYVADTYAGRSEAISRTELGFAHNAGVITVAEKSGLAARVAVHDGTGDGPCKARNGLVLTLEEARGEGLNHPNCALRLIPIVSEVAA